MSAFLSGCAGCDGCVRCVLPELAWISDEASLSGRRGGRRAWSAVPCGVCRVPCAVSRFMVRAVRGPRALPHARCALGIGGGDSLRWRRPHERTVRRGETVEIRSRSMPWRHRTRTDSVPCRDARPHPESRSGSSEWSGESSCETQTRTRRSSTLPLPDPRTDPLPPLASCPPRTFASRPSRAARSTPSRSPQRDLRLGCGDAGDPVDAGSARASPPRP